MRGLIIALVLISSSAHAADKPLKERNSGVCESGLLVASEAWVWQAHTLGTYMPYLVTARVYNINSLRRDFALRLIRNYSVDIDTELTVARMVYGKEVYRLYYDEKFYDTSKKLSTYPSGSLVIMKDGLVELAIAPPVGGVKFPDIRTTPGEVRSYIREFVIDLALNPQGEDHLAPFWTDDSNVNYPINFSRNKELLDLYQELTGLSPQPILQKALRAITFDQEFLASKKRIKILNVNLEDPEIYPLVNAIRVYMVKQYEKYEKTPEAQAERAGIEAKVDEVMKSIRDDVN